MGATRERRVVRERAGRPQPEPAPARARGPSARRPRGSARVLLAAAALLWAHGAAVADYRGPLIDAHGHLSGLAHLDPYVAALDRHGVTHAVLLGVGGVQRDDPKWLAEAVRRHPGRISAGLPLPDPVAPWAARDVERALAAGGQRVVGEAHLRQVGRITIDRSPEHPAFLALLDVLGPRRIPLVVHYELTDAAAAALGNALTARPGAVVVLAHAGEGPPARLRALLGRHPNLHADLSGMHFLRKPALATETGPLDPEWKALIEAFPDRFLAGVDAWAPRLFEPAMLDRLFRWTRRILGELSPDVAERVAWRNAGRLYRLP